MRQPGQLLCNPLVLIACNPIYVHNMGPYTLPHNAPHRGMLRQRCIGATHAGAHTMSTQLRTNTTAFGQCCTEAMPPLVHTAGLLPLLSYMCWLHIAMQAEYTSPTDIGLCHTMRHLQELLHSYGQRLARCDVVCTASCKWPLFICAEGSQLVPARSPGHGCAFIGRMAQMCASRADQLVHL